MVKLLVALAAVMFMVFACVSSRHAKVPAPADPLATARYACRLFIERKEIEARRDAEWGEYYNWTVVENADGTLGVGARYAVAGHTRYTTCIIRRAGDNYVAESINRLQ